MKFKKIISAILAATMVTACTYSAVLAEDSNIVYTYVDENGQTVNITQAELDAEHWNVDALGEELPIVYEDFPARILDEVNQFSELSVYVKYMKDDVDSAQLQIIDMANNSPIFTTSLTSGEVQSPVLPIGKSYQFKITETIDGTQTEYNKFVKTITETAKMPEYVTADSTTSEQTVLVGDVEDLRASEKDNGDGNIEIIPGAKRFDKVAACDLSDYFDTLSDNAIYKIYTKSEDGSTYSGFMSTYSNGESLGIYMPTIEVREWADATQPSTMSFDGNVTTSDFNNAINISSYRDYAFAANDSKNLRFKIFKFELPELITEGTPPTIFNLNVFASSALTVDVYTKVGSSYAKRHSITRDNGRLVMETILAGLNVENLTEGDYIYFVVYLKSATKGLGYFTFNESSDTYDDDVTGSVYEAYTEQELPALLPVNGQWYTYTNTDFRDVDAFYVDYSGSQPKGVKMSLNNKLDLGNDKRRLYIEMSSVMTDITGMPSTGLSDVIEVMSNYKKDIVLYPNVDCEYVMSVSSVSTYDIDDAVYNRDNVNSIDYSICAVFD